MPRPAEVTAVYFPSYHRDEWYDRWYGDGWNEWRLVEQGRPLFPGHQQPVTSAWGPFDEADPRWMERQIDLAADHGITCFLFDWYWYGGRKFLYRALEDGFLQARNRQRLKYFVMWANHTWGVFPACRDIFRGDSERVREVYGQALAYDKPLLEITHTQADLERVAQYCVDHYFADANYLRIDGKPVFSFWHWTPLETSLGGPDGIAEGFERMRRVARRAGYDGLHIQVNIACYEGPDTYLCWRPGLTDLVRRCGGDSVFGYNVARTTGYAALTNERPLVPYADVVASHAELFRRCENLGLPFHPTVTLGFDNSTRWARDTTLPVDFRKLGYEPIVADNTPALFQQALREALASLERSGESTMLILNAWNEWTEGNYLLPDTRQGLAYLEALRAVLQDA